MSHPATRLILTYNPEDDWIFADWQGVQTAETITEGCERILAALKHYGCTKLLTQTEVLSEAWLQTGNWVAHNWFPRLGRAGCQFVAWVAVPEANAPNDTLVQDITTWDLKEITWLLFDNRESAEAWLREN